MIDSAVLDTILGLVFVFYASALVCSGAVEAASNLLKKRSKYLLRGMRDLLEGQVKQPLEWWWNNAPGTDRTSEQALYNKSLGLPSDTPVGWVDAVMSHPLTLPYKHLTANGAVRRNPSYLPAPVFTKALLDLLPVPEGQPVTPVALASGLPLGHLRSALLALAKSAGNNLDSFERSLEGWFDGEMDRISGSYKRWAKRWAVVVALVVVSVFQLDTIAIARALYTDGTTRAAVVQAATSDKLCPPTPSPATPSPSPTSSGQPPPSADCIPAKLVDLQQAGLPVGWPGHLPHGFTEWVFKVIGLAMTAAAAALGAPFWFNALSKIASLRNSGTKPGSST